MTRMAIQPMSSLALSLMILQFVVLQVSSEDPIVKTDKGNVLGYVQQHNDVSIRTFLGIPYAAPPLGDLRFQPPAQLDPWEGILNTTELPNSCMQPLDFYFGNFSGATMWNPNTAQSEDCLYLNLWVSEKPSEEKKPVIVWIYGGGFYSGSSTLDIYDPVHLVSEMDVIVVSMQYRVGPLGFLSLDTPEAPGNAGLWDQRMALEWVNRNIHQFGGDPQSVTLMGESAGSVSVGLFLICDLCRGYFHKAIMQSGSPNAHWAVLPKEEMWRRSKVLADKVQCNSKDPEDVITCLRNADPSKIVAHVFDVAEGTLQCPFVPIVDGIFIRQDPNIMIQNGHFKKIPILIGSNENEATYFMIYADSDIFNRETNSPVSPHNYGKVMDEYTFKYFPTYPNELSDLGRQAVKFYYRNWLNPEDGVENRKSIDHAVSDANFVCPSIEFAKAYARQDAPVYYYWFNQRWSANPWPEWMGVLHADEIWFTFGHPLNKKYSFSESEKELSLKMMTYWANFAKTGHPSNSLDDTEWPRFTSEEQKFRVLSNTTISSGQQVSQFPRTEQCAFWRGFLPKVIEQSCRLNDVETTWQEQFQTWKNRYIEGWNDQFDTFLDNFKSNARQCRKNP